MCSGHAVVTIVTCSRHAVVAIVPCSRHAVVVTIMCKGTNWLQEASTIGFQGAHLSHPYPKPLLPTLFSFTKQYSRTQFSSFSAALQFPLNVYVYFSVQAFLWYYFLLPVSCMIPLLSRLLYSLDCLNAADCIDRLQAEFTRANIVTSLHNIVVRLIKSFQKYF